MKIKIIYDFVCQFCYVADEVMWRALDGKLEKIEFEWCPFELNPEPEPQPLVTEEKRERFETKLMPYAIKENVEINFPTVSPIPRTALSFEGVQVAKEFKKENSYIREVMDGYWVHNKNIGDIDVLADLAEKAGIDRKYFRNALNKGKYREFHKKLNEEVSGWDFEVVPTFYINGVKQRRFPVTMKAWEKILEENYEKQSYKQRNEKPKK